MKLLIHVTIDYYCFPFDMPLHTTVNDDSIIDKMDQSLFIHSFMSVLIAFYKIPFSILSFERILKFVYIIHGLGL